MKEVVWLAICASLFGIVAVVWWQQVVGFKEGQQTSAETTAEIATATSKATTLTQSMEDLEKVLDPIVQRVIQQNQFFPVIVQKDPKESFTSPDITFDNKTHTMHIVLPQGRPGPDGRAGAAGKPGETPPPGPRGPKGIST